MNKSMKYACGEVLGVRKFPPGAPLRRGGVSFYSAPFPPVGCDHGSPEKERVHKLLTCGQASPPPPLSELCLADPGHMVT